QRDHLVAGHHQEEPRRGIRRGGNIDAYMLTGQVAGDPAAGRARQECDGPAAGARILHQHGLAERLAAWREQRIAALPYRIVDGTHQRDPAEQCFPLLEQGAAQQVGGEHAGQQHDGDDQREAEAGNINAEQRLRGQEAWHEAFEGCHEQTQDPQGDGQWNPDQQPGDEVLLESAHGMPAGAQVAAAGAAGAAAGAAESLLAGESGLAAESAPALAPPGPLRKSVTYQPEPFNWKPAAVTCLANVAWPHSGQAESGASEIFCSTSWAWPQALHL